MRDDVPAKVFQLQSVVNVLGAPLVFTYGRFGVDDGARLVAGDVISVEAGIPGRGEIATITSAAGLTATAVFANAHPAGGAITTGPIPIWNSDKRNILVIVSDAASADPERRRKVNDLMARICRAVTTWSIVKQHSSVQTGPFQIGISSIGNVPLGAISIP